MLYDQWYAKTEGGTKEMSAEDSRELVDLYGKTPPPANSPELKAEKITEAIKNWWTETGISKWDNNYIETLNKELQNAIREYNKTTGNGIPVPGSEDTTGMSPAGVLRIRQQEYDEAATSGDKDRIIQASIALESAKSSNEFMKSGMPWDRERNTFFTGDGGLSTKNDDERANDRLMVYGSEDAGSPARQAYDEFIANIRTIKPEHIQKLNERDDINKIIPDIMTDRTGQQLLEAIQRLHEITIRYDNEN
jgi:hypothetical protein